MCSASCFFDLVVHIAKGPWIVRSSLLLASLLELPFIAAGQEATIVGMVSDPSGSAVSNAAITIANEKTGAIRSLVTNDAG